MRPFFHNIILFGESGAGKSSVVNMIIGSDRAKISSDPMGCTFRHKDYDASFNNFSCNIYDTAGLNEGDQGRVPHWMAIRQLYTLIRNLDSVTLLICCVRGRIKENTHANWTLFHDVICGGHVPVILVMTGLEHEDDWNSPSRLKRIRDSFGVYNMKPKEIATVVSIRGLRNEYLDMYTDSQTRLRNIISAPRRPWSTDKETWFRDIYVRAYSEAFLLEWFGIGTKVEFGRKIGSMLQLFAEQTGMKEGDLKKLEDTLLEAERKISKQETGFRAKVLEFVKRNLDKVEWNTASEPEQQETLPAAEKDRWMQGSLQAEENESQRLASWKNPDEEKPKNFQNASAVEEQGQGKGFQVPGVHDEKNDREGSNARSRRDGDNREKGKQAHATKKGKRFAKVKGIFSSKDKQKKSQKRPTAAEGNIPGVPPIRSDSPNADKDNELEDEQADWETA